MKSSGHGVMNNEAVPVIVDKDKEKGKKDRGGSFYWLYILECSNGAYYTGITTDLARRYRQHVSGRGGARFTRAFKPLRVARCWKFHGPRGGAQRLEYALKSLDRRHKEEIIARPGLLKKFLEELPESKQLRVARVPKIEE